MENEREISLDPHQNRITFPVINFEIRIEGHPGYREDVTENRIVNRRTRTDFEGTLSLSPQYSIISSTLGATKNKFGGEVSYTLPFGNPKMELRLDVDKESALRLWVKRLPYAVSAHFPRIWQYGKDQTTMFILNGDDVLTGIPVSEPGVRTTAIILNHSSWQKTGDRDIRDKILLLPNDPDFWKTMRVMIGDKKPVQ